MNQSNDEFSKTPNGSYGISDDLLIYNEENAVIAGPFFTERDAVNAARLLAKQSGQRVYCWGKMCRWSMDPDEHINEGNPFVKRRRLGNLFTSWKRDAQK